MTIDSYDNADAEALLRAGEERLARTSWARRERLTDGVAAAGFLAAAAALAVLAPWGRPLAPLALAAALLVYVVAEHIHFPAAGGWTKPTQLALVPMLFVLPTPLVPLIVAAGIVLGRGSDWMRGRLKPNWLAILGDGWFALGPALVLIVAHAQVFDWGRWPVYVGAFAAQVAGDFGAFCGRSWFAERVGPRVQVPLLAWAYAVDAALLPIGLMIAAVAIGHSARVLLALPLIGLLRLLSLERRERLEKVQTLSAAYRGTALLLGDVIEADDPYTGDHSRAVVELSCTVAAALRLDAAGRRNVELGALLHDVGKIRVPKEIITKPGPLTDAEMGIVRRHTIEGELMLRRVGGVLLEVGRIVRASHERWDGAGYPDGLAGEEIPIEARIIAACDTYNAMTTDRPYRAARPAAEALAELERCSGSQFDPRVVVALRETLAAEARAHACHQPRARPRTGALALVNGASPRRLDRSGTPRAHARATH